MNLRQLLRRACYLLMSRAEQMGARDCRESEVIVCPPWEVVIALNTVHGLPQATRPPVVEFHHSPTEEAILDLLTAPRSTNELARLLKRDADSFLYRCLGRLKKSRQVRKVDGRWVKR